MKKGLLSLLAVALLSACGGGEEKAGANTEEMARKYCECIKSGVPCEKEFATNDSLFKADPKIYEAFKEAALKSCPEAKPEIEQLKP